MAEQGRFLYFAYGSNMLWRRLCAKNRAPSAMPEGIGYVEEHRLTFNKLSKGTKVSSGKCDMEWTGVASDRVWGVLFSILKSEEGPLDKAEGLGEGYRKNTEVRVVTAEATKVATAYIATEKDASLKPYHWYKAFVVAGAVEHELPFAYVEWLRTFESQPDPAAQRRAENEALLFVSDERKRNPGRG
jgi:hypothetical protein